LKIAIISAGFSSADLDFDSIEADQIISVNIAATKSPCDYWVFNDAEAFAKWGGRVGSPVFFTRKIVHRHLEQLTKYRGLGLDLKIHNHPLVYQDDIHSPVEQWNLYSGCAALGLAWYLGATEILLYGYDMGGDRDCSGGSCSQGRTAERWINERVVFDRWLKFFEATFVSVDWVIDGVQNQSNHQR